MHRVAVIAVPPVTPFDLSIPDLILGNAEVDNRSAYKVTMCTAEPGLVATTGSLGVSVDHGLEAIRSSDTVIVTGTGNRERVDGRVLDALRRAATRDKRIASICTGAFVLAEAGLLDGRTATTYWPYSDEFRRRYPRVQLRADVLYVDDGMILTSAGLAAGIDLCLHLIRRDFGARVANAVARRAVVAPIRPGGQAQFVETAVADGARDSLARTRAWALRQLDRPLSLEDVAHHAGMSVRNLSRRFKAETGQSPLQWLLYQRIDRARELLESTALPVGQVAARSGLGTADSLRKHMVRRLGVPPSSYRATFSRLTTG
ncbi:AraC family transcriptional regulator [Mycobacterium sp. IEC1808]|uniref:GlxA family transcriptional regulator n=1 Tax=Mycobacterium sp. IEC1808 TaxID=1743230 RepID=UPI000A1467F8|nr:helix-turn-helix domain-containing protein [Mycobacterium sp. IEC1808]ORW96213.1 AraC family transcriptional regulator [Mycobacterium sp. IEC1808]